MAFMKNCLIHLTTLKECQKIAKFYVCVKRER